MRKKWSKPDEEKLKTIYPKFGAKKCANIFGRTISSIANKTSILDLNCDFHPYWRSKAIGLKITRKTS